MIEKTLKSPLIFYVQYLQIPGCHYTTPPCYGAAEPELHYSEDDQEDGLGVAGHQGRRDYPDEASAYPRCWRQTCCPT
jgi:hypothetical protein